MQRPPFLLSAIAAFAKSASILTIAGGLAFAMAGAASDKAADGPTEIVVETELPADNLHAKKLDTLSDLATRLSNRMMTLTIRHNVPFRANLVRSLDGSSQPKIVQLQLSELDPSNPTLTESSRPMRISSFAQARQFFEKRRPAYEAACEKLSLKLLYVAPWPPSGIFTKSPLARPSSFEQLQLRTYDSMSEAFFSATGAKAANMSYFQMRRALLRGSLNAVLTSSVTGVDVRLWERMRHFLRLNYAFPLVAVVMRDQHFGALSANQRQALLTAAKTVESDTWRDVEDADSAALEVLVAHGVTVASPPSTLAVYLQQIAREFRAPSGSGGGARATTISIRPQEQ